MEHGIYVASKSDLAPMWRDYRASGFPISSTWIDDDDPDPALLWERCISEASKAYGVVAFYRTGDVWKGALVEIGAALANDVPVWLVGDPPGSWTSHPRVTRARTPEQALILANEWMGLRLAWADPV